MRKVQSRCSLQHKLAQNFAGTLLTQIVSLQTPRSEMTYHLTECVLPVTSAYEDGYTKDQG